MYTNISEVYTSYYIVICHHLNEYNKKRGRYLTFSSLFIYFCILVYLYSWVYPNTSRQGEYLLLSENTPLGEYRLPVPSHRSKKLPY